MFCVRARARAKWREKLCAARMRNAIISWNHLKKNWKRSCKVWFALLFPATSKWHANLLHLFRRLIDRNKYITLKQKRKKSGNIEWLSSVSLISFRAQYVMFGNIHGIQMSSVCESVLILYFVTCIASRKYRTHIRSSLSGKEFESELETWNK